MLFLIPTENGNGREYLLGRALHRGSLIALDSTVFDDSTLTTDI